MIEFRIDCVPPKAPGSAKRIMRYGARTIVAKTKAANETEDTLLTLFAPHRPAEALGGPLAALMIWTWPYRASDSKRVKEREWIAHTVRPDADNLAKTACDVLTRLRFVEDDAQFCDLRIIKRFGRRPGIEVRIEMAAQRSSAWEEPVARSGQSDSDS